MTDSPFPARRSGAPQVESRLHSSVWHRWIAGRLKHVYLKLSWGYLTTNLTWFQPAKNLIFCCNKLGKLRYISKYSRYSTNLPFKLMLCMKSTDELKGPQYVLTKRCLDQATTEVQIPQLFFYFKNVFYSCLSQQHTDFHSLK